MPAPDRVGQIQSFNTVIQPNKGIVGHYSDLEIDALLAQIQVGGGGNVDLSAYATTVYVDGELQKVYSKAEVDAALAALQVNLPSIDLSNYYTKPEVDQAIAGAATGGTVDLASYATVDYVDGVKQEILGAATVAFQERYTKQEVDGLFVKKDDMVAPPNLDGYATEQYVDDSIARAKVDAYTKAETDSLLDSIKDFSIANDNNLLAGLTSLQEVVSRMGSGEGAGTIDVLRAIQGVEIEPLSVKFTDNVTSPIQWKGNLSLAPVVSGDGYRLAWSDGKGAHELAYTSDLDSLNDLLPRVESLENKPAGDLSDYAKLDDDKQVIVSDKLYANRFFLDADKSIILLVSNGQERPVFRSGTKNNALAFVSELAAYCTIADAATQISLCAKKVDTYTKAETYTRDEVDGKLAPLANAADVYTKAEVETRLLQVPSPMNYLVWGGVFTAMPVAGFKDKWSAIGIIPSFAVFKGKHYKLDLTIRLGSNNTDIKEQWVGVRAYHKATGDFPCTKPPLVSLTGWGHTTVTKTRASVAAATGLTPTTKAELFRQTPVDDWQSTGDLLFYSVEWEADSDMASLNLALEASWGGSWSGPAEIVGVVCVVRQMD